MDCGESSAGKQRDLLTRDLCVQVVKSKSSYRGMHLNFDPLEKTANEHLSLVKLDLDDVLEGINKWKYAVVGFMVGTLPPFSVIKKFVDTKWNHLGKMEIFCAKQGIFVFNFSDEASKNEVLEQSPWLWGSKMLFLKPWSLDFDLSKDIYSTVPIWIRFPSLKLANCTVIPLVFLAN